MVNWERGVRSNNRWGVITFNQKKKKKKRLDGLNKRAKHKGTTW